MSTTSMSAFTQTALHNWEQTVKRASAIFDSYSDEELLKEIVPGKNRVAYLLGHFAAVNDRMLPLLGLGERLYPHFDELFLNNPDNIQASYPALQELRASWKAVNERLAAGLQRWTPEEWLQKHTAVSEEDFAKEPLRNRLSVVLSRSGHISYHLGQLVWFKK